MSASSAAAASAITRPRGAILGFTSVASIVAAVSLIYYFRSQFSDLPESLDQPSPASGLHRSNAVHHRRRRTNEGNSDEIPREPPINGQDDTDARETLARPLGDEETVVDEPWNDEWSNWGNEPPSQRNGQNIVQLLFRVSEDATRRNAYVHRGCRCNSCGTVPIRGIRYRCSNCSDFDLCEACEAQGLHTKTHIFYKVRIPTSSFAIRQMQPVWYLGDPDTCMKSLPKELMSRLSKETGFDRPELDAYWEQWTFMANTEWREDPDDLRLAMDRKTFDQCLIPSGGNRYTAPNLIHDRMFAFYDTNNDNLISFPEFLNGLAYRKKKDKLKRVFEGFDIDGDGFVDRKDFLRMFRSYYVLYKQMHRDILEGLDDQVMNSIDTHQLITSRQPLSSAFGRDGRFPPAPNPRTGEGKSPGVDGDLTITDGKGVISDSGNDLGNKEDVIVDAALREHPQQPWAPTGSSVYWRAVTNPPETIASLQHDVLEALIRERRRVLQDATRRAQNQSSNMESELGEMNDYSEDTVDRNWPPSFVTSSDVEVVCGEGTSIAAVRPLQQPEVVEYALRRLRELSSNHEISPAKERIHERWKRRQFYTDEEEGAVAPPDWKEEEDIPELNMKVADSSNETVSPSRPISPRSRSSSKVRFVEDTDDYETRSNPSTSSRSIPERWGGMEIPDVEKDAGKEILYQVTQQACNELLDQLFKKTEDFAIAALSSKKDRNKYRHLFTNSYFEQWALEVDRICKRVNLSIETPSDIRHEVAIPEVELSEVRQRPLDDLLAATGYTVHPPAENSTGTSLALDTSVGSQLVDSTELGSGLGNTPFLESSGAGVLQTPEPNTILERPVSSQSGFLPENFLYGDESTGGTEARALEVTTGSSHPEAHQLSLVPEAEAAEVPSSSQGELPYRDPTLPQFRPNSPPLNSPTSRFPSAIPPQEANLVSADRTHLNSSAASSVTEVPPLFHRVEDAPNGPYRPNPEKPDFGSVPAIQTSPPSKEERNSLLTEFDKSKFMLAGKSAKEAMPEDLRKEFAGLDWNALYKLREMEAIEKQAEARGGWGRLSWEEFEKRIKGEDQLPLTENSRRAMMDFLGSWIEICIP